MKVKLITFWVFSTSLMTFQHWIQSFSLLSPSTDCPAFIVQEAINLCSLADRQNHTDVVIANLTATIVNTTADSDGASTVNDVTEVVGKMDDKLQKVSLDLQNQTDSADGDMWEAG
jgi:hypothetical protein